MLSDDFYRALEERFRGTKETIKARQSIYLPVVQALHATVDKKALDVGCGRGEWLELLGEHGIPAEGLDLNEEFVEAGRAAGLSVTKADAMQFLASQPANAYGLVSAFHVVEHLGFDNLLAFLKEAHRVLDDGGAILLETPNPANLVVGACNFYLDPTHERPIPSVLLSFACEYSGFESAVVVPVNRGVVRNDLEMMPIELAGATVINKVVSVLDDNLMQAPDYAVIAFKRHNPELVATAQSLVSGSLLAVSKREEDSVDLLNLTVVEAQAEVRRWQERAYQAELRIRDFELKLSEAERRAEAERFRIEQRAATAEVEIVSLQDQINAMYNSRSWRLSAPVRLGGMVLRKAPVSRPAAKRLVTLGLLHAAAYVRCRPVLKARLSTVLSRFPKLRSRLVGALGIDALRGVAGNGVDEVDSVDRLTARGRKVYADLTKAKDSSNSTP
ncbi:class I SAM-dependent methyltransferase [Trinickia sp. LjRoot230]|uniref:class I SAM-dependent methyltransferase n=1 Tax=Trinickia sp. LjRoot230 TaxID=3342288 RepID=UPI003ECC272A